ncbi:MAG: YfhO family protein, partial [Clostridiales bacterium]
MKKFFSKFKVNIIVFFIPVFIYLLTYIIFGVYPFKDKIILISDMYSQYIHYYIYIYDSISNLDFFSLIYSWNIGLGNSFIGLFSSYLSSPLNLIILLFPKKNLTEAIFIITILKIGFSAVSFSFFLNYLHKDNKSYCIIFSVLYSLMSYMVVYSFNIMWLDSVIYLPLVAMGINKIVKEKKFILYCISLFLTIISNYYTGYMVCIFSILYFLIVYFSVNDLKDVKIFLHRFKLFIISSLLAGILSSYLIIPTYFSLKNTNSFGSGNLEMKANYDFIDLFSKMIINSYDTLTVGLPNVYCGLIVLILVPLYFFNTKYSIKEKILYFIFIVFLIFSFNISAFNIIWHGFDYPNWFPYRYSFIFSFILLKLAFKAFVELKNIKFFIIVGYTSILILTIIVIQKLDYDFINDISITLSILIILVYTTLLSLFKINFKKNI